MCIRDSNDIYLAPRKVIGSLGGVQVLEAEKNGTKSMCCGAGGGRFWMEEDTGKNVNVERSQQLLATGASRIATACPFCYVMIDDGVKGEGVDEDEVMVADIAIHMLEALERGDAIAERQALTPVVESPVAITSRPVNPAPAAVAAAAAPVAVLEAGDAVGEEAAPDIEVIAEADTAEVEVVEVVDDIEVVKAEPAVADAVDETADEVAAEEVVDEPMQADTGAAETEDAEVTADDASVVEAEVAKEPVVADVEAEADIVDTEITETAAVETKAVDTDAASGAGAGAAAVAAAPAGAVAAGSGEVDNTESAAWRTVEPDDLKVIKGIGPKLESLLHEIGVRTYEQIAAFPAAYIGQLDDFLSFTGRIDRDNWVGQAAELAQTRPAKTAVLPPIPDDTPDNATSQ